MAKIMGLHDPTASSRRKKTRQGMGRNTKYGHGGGGPRGARPSKTYKKRYRGQGR